MTEDVPDSKETGLHTTEASNAVTRDFAFTISPEFVAAIQRWQESMRPVARSLALLQKQLKETVAPFAESVWRTAVIDQQCGRLEALGWLPHTNSPFNLVEEEITDTEATDRKIETYYREGWVQLGTKLVNGIVACDLDQEAKDTFAEAVTAHGAGLYRCAPRLLFPEIERVSRKEIYGGALSKMASQKRLVDAIGGLGLSEVSSIGVVGLRFYRKLTEHLYINVLNDTAVIALMADPVPNRHASLHGIIPYNSPKSSINAILVADYLLRAISALKQLAVTDAGEAPDTT